MRAGHKHGKHGSGALLSSFPLILAVVLAEHGGRLSSVDRDREFRIWNERGARQNECETRCWLTLERVRNSLLESFRSRRFSMLAGLDAKVTIWIDPLTLSSGSGVRTDSIIMEDAVRALQQQVNALKSQNAALEA